MLTNWSLVSFGNIYIYIVSMSYSALELFRNEGLSQYRNYTANQYFISKIIIFILAYLQFLLFFFVKIIAKVYFICVNAKSFILLINTNTFQLENINFDSIRYMKFSNRDSVEPDFSTHTRTITVQGETYRQNFCRKCMIYQIRGTLHCNECGRCVLDKKFHCMWFCIGKENFIYFIYYIVTLLFIIVIK